MRPLVFPLEWIDLGAIFSKPFRPSIDPDAQARVIIASGWEKSQTETADNSERRLPASRRRPRAAA
jgi:hypothetical protein